ncbi:MAG: phage major capsid protein [Armatimonadota bacterium]|nr:phage major capsid protein [Armatimonadota bacterium]
MGLAAGILDNRSVLEKADLALADLTTGGGLLQPAQAQKFIRILIDESVILKQGTVVPMKSPKQLIEKIRFGGRILRAGSEATALPAGDRSKPDLSQVELDAQLFKAEVRLNNEVLEDSIERGQLRQTIMQMMAEAISRDMDEVIVRGDTASPDPFLAKLDGILKQATSNIVDAMGQTTNKGIFRDMLKSMPSAFLRNKREMRFFTSVDSEIDYRDSLAERATVVGDKFLEQDEPVAYSGVPVVDVPMFPENLGAGGNTTNVLLTDPKNINVGIWRQIRIETDKLVSEGVLIIVATLRFDVKFAEETAVVKAINVKVGA